MRKLSIFIILSILLISAFFLFYERPSVNAAASASASAVIEEQNQPPELYFCPEDDCINVLIQMANKSAHIDCAIYDIKDKNFLNILQEKNARVYTDRNYEKNLAGYALDYRMNKYYLMHDKFCIFDDEAVFTGSFNAVKNQDDNNLFIIYSRNLAKNYEDEFNELRDGKYPAKTQNPKVNVNGILFESYFCPEDWCANKEIDAIKNAKESIVFMTFSFTHDGIADALIEKKKEGLQIAGIVEKGQITKDSVYDRLKSAGIDVVPDGGKELMHHKVFIIDGKIVITGSMNPTKNGDTGNNENILIVHSSDAAERFLKEFERLRNK